MYAINFYESIADIVSLFGKKSLEFMTKTSA